jgi:hypothetical protein
LKTNPSSRKRPESPYWARYAAGMPVYVTSHTTQFQDERNPRYGCSVRLM